MLKNAFKLPSKLPPFLSLLRIHCSQIGSNLRTQKQGITYVDTHSGPGGVYSLTVRLQLHCSFSLLSCCDTSVVFKYPFTWLLPLLLPPSHSRTWRSRRLNIARVCPVSTISLALPSTTVFLLYRNSRRPPQSPLPHPSTSMKKQAPVWQRQVRLTFVSLALPLISTMYIHYIAAFRSLVKSRFRTAVLNCRSLANQRSPSPMMLSVMLRMIQLLLLLLLMVRAKERVKVRAPRLSCVRGR